MSLKPSILSRFKISIWASIAVGGVLLLALASCDPPQESSYLLRNATGQLIVAATVSDTSGGQALTNGDIPRDDAELLAAGPRKRDGNTVTVQWLAAPGVARWREATVPLKIEEAAGATLHIYLRRDHMVCAGLRDEPAALAATPAVNSPSFSCVKSVELPRLAPGMSQGMKRGSVTHSAPFFAEHASPPLIYQTLTHKTSPVELFGEDEFWSVRELGNQSGWLVYAPVQRGESSMFVVTADASGWKSRYLGPVRQLDGLLPEPRITFTGMQGFRMVADIATAEFFFFPGAPNREYWILGQSTDGRHVAIAIPQENAEVGDLHDAVFNLKMLNLEQGKIVDGIVATMPPMSEERSIERFYSKWYTEHCAWTPLLNCK